MQRQRRPASTQQKRKSPEKKADSVRTADASRKQTQRSLEQPKMQRPAVAPAVQPTQRKSREQIERERLERDRRVRQNREAAKAAQRRHARAVKKRKEARRPRPAIVYTQPAAFNRSRLLMQLLIVTAVVLAVVMGLSIFFKVGTITVSGANAYSEWAVREASGLSEGDNLLTFSDARVSGRIIAQLPYVKNVRIGIKLPDTVNIIIEEEKVVYAIQSSDGLWWLITSGGKIVEQTDGGTAGNYTKILGVMVDSPLLGEIANAFETPTVPPTAETDAQGNIIGTEPVVITDSERLSTALEILCALEANDIVGEAASVDVTDIGEIELWYGQKYRVKLGDQTQIDKKIASMYAAINSEKLKNGYGELDVSFTIWPDKVMYTPFE